MSLLADAKAFNHPKGPSPSSYVISDEVIELSVAWARGEVTNAQAAAALGLTRATSGYYAVLARALRTAVERGILK